MFSWFLALLVLVAVFGAAILAAQSAPTFPFAASTINNTLPNTIALRVTGPHEEALSSSSAAFYPGSLLQFQSDGSVVPHATYAGGGELLFAKEDAFQGHGLLDAYNNTDQVFYCIPRNGDIINALLAPGANVAEGGALVSDGTGQMTTPPGTSGLQLYQNVADSTAIASSNTETAFSLTYTLPAGFLQAGDVIDIEFLVDGIGVTATPTLRTRLEFTDSGSTTRTILDTGTAAVIASDLVQGTAKVVIRTTGASGTMVAEGNYTAGTPGTAVRTDYHMTSTAIDTTKTQTIKVTATWSASSSSNTCLLRVFNIKLQREAKVRGYALQAVNNQGTTFLYVPMRVA